MAARIATGCGADSLTVDVESCSRLICLFVYDPTACKISESNIADLNPSFPLFFAVYKECSRMKICLE
jgi:hypothetical protein